MFEQMRPMLSRGRTRTHLIASVVLLCSALAWGQSPDAKSDGAGNENKPAEGAIPLDFNAPQTTEVEMRPTEYGLRFTPGMADALAKQAMRDMRRRYELNDEQVEKAQQILSRNMMKLAQDSQKYGRDAMELMIENMIANEGTFRKEDGQKWAKMMRPFMGEFKEFIGTTASQLGGIMTFSQRMRLTAEMTALSAGFVAFDERLKSWEKGDVPDYGNPFFDNERQDRVRRERSGADRQPGESQDVQRARRRAEQRMGWDSNVDERWSQYVDSAIEYYELNESQAKSARALLKDYLERAKQIKSDQWTEKVKRNRMAATMSYQLPPAVRNGPWMWQLDQEYDALLRPLQDLGKELRTKVDELADSTQREKAAAKARGELDKSGLKLPAT